MQISVSGDLEKFIEEKVSAGQYGSANELVEDALTLFREQTSLTQEDINKLRELIDPALEELDRGEGENWDPDEIKAEGRQLFARRRN